MKPLIFSYLAMLHTPFVLFAQNKMLKTQAISIFKDGSSFVVKSRLETSVKGGEEITIRYSYKVFVPNVNK